MWTDSYSKRNKQSQRRLRLTPMRVKHQVRLITNSHDTVLWYKATMT